MKQIMLFAATRTLALSTFTATLLGLSTSPVLAIDLREAKFTQVVNSVTVTNPQGQNGHQAEVNSLFTTPDIIRTGIDSRAELTASDQTVTRVGANTIFSFKPEGRGINLQKGSVLFNSPTGRGGGTIQTAAATASVLGTTIIVTTTGNGGFKLLVLEGKAKATLPNGRDFVLKAGQMTFITPGMTQTPQVFEFRLGKQSEGSNLLKGFSKPLPAQDKVQQAITVQDVQIANGDKADTGLMIGDVVGNEVQIVDPNLIQTAMQTLSKSEDPDAATIAKFQQAVTVDSTVSSTLFDDAQTVYFRNADVLKRSLEAVGDTSTMSDLPNSTWAYAAKNLYIATGLPIDLSAYTDANTFAFYGKESVEIIGNLNVSYFPGEVTVRSQGTLSFTGMVANFNAREASLVANDASMWVISGKSFTNSGGQIRIKNEGSGKLSFLSTTFTGKAIDNLHAIELDSAGDMELISGTYNTSGPSGTVGIGIDAKGTLSLSSFVFNSTTQSVRITGGTGGDAIIAGTSTITAQEFNLSDKNNVYTTGTATIITADKIKFAVVGSVNLNNGTFTATTSLNVSGQNITVNTSTFSSTSPSTGTATFSGGASGIIDMSNVNFAPLYSFNSISMQAYTINLTNVNFASGQSVYLTSGLVNPGGVPNFGASTPGRVNFISGVTYGGNAITDGSSFATNGTNIHLNQ